MRDTDQCSAKLELLCPSNTKPLTLEPDQRRKGDKLSWFALRELMLLHLTPIFLVICSQGILHNPFSKDWDPNSNLVFSSDWKLIYHHLVFWPRFHALWVLWFLKDHLLALGSHDFPHCLWRTLSGSGGLTTFEGPYNVPPSWVVPSFPTAHLTCSIPRVPSF